jgi:hypothetical protein
METEIRLSTVLNLDSVFYFLVPLVSDKETFLNTLIKFTPNLRNNVKIVTIDSDKKEDYIAYNELASKNETLSNTFFAIFDYNILVHYAGNILNTKSDNRFLIFININEINLSKKSISLIGPKTNVVFFYAKNLDMPINFTSSVRKSYILGDHFKAYLDDYIRTQSTVSLDNKENTSSAKLLNVYFDEKIKSLENISLDKALQRAPKFKTILLDILTKNKKRHIVKMIDGKYGMDSFVTVYNKLKNSPVLVTIKKADNFDTKIKKLQIFNESNAPGVLLTDYNFSQKMMPMNIDYYHITDGGVEDDNITFFESCQGRNYSGTYPRNIELLSHIGVSLGDDITIDLEKNDKFMKNYNIIIRNYDDIKMNSYPVYLKGNEFYSSYKK